jgi:hypothetical protein
MSQSNKVLSWIIIASVSYTALVIMVLHFLQPDKNPAVNAISEYVDGSSGGLMTSVFFIQSIGSIALAMLVIRIGSQERKVLVGGVLFILAAFGDAVAGLFPADPITDQTMTSTGIVHMVGGLTRFISLALALPILSFDLIKKEPWKDYSRALKGLGTSFVIIFLGTVFVLAPSGLFGLGQRIFIGVALSWMFVIGFSIIQVNK